jgi:spore photoproduct lyase
MPLTTEILARFKDATIIPIRSYTDMFNRPQQEWQAQKKSQKLILAVKKEGLLYPGTAIAPDFGFENFFYNTPLLNCVYDCSYCYLQGLYQSANLVLFVNESDFFSSVTDTLKTVESMYLCISYETDLLGFESLFGLNRRWIEFARTTPGLLIESRTKSANFNALSGIDPHDAFIIAWTLSPEPIRCSFEQHTPSLQKRISALKKALEAGWQVRICLDPLLITDNWQKTYSDFIQQLAVDIPLERVRDFTIGVFRMNQQFLKHIKKQGRNSSPIYYPYSIRNGVATYEPELETGLKDFVYTELRRLGIPEHDIAVV